MKWRSNPRVRWYTLAVLWVILLILGVGGFVQQSGDADLGRNGLETLYLTLQLATLDYGGGDSALNWRLELARFVAPMMAAGTVVQTASLVFREQFDRLRARRGKGHTVIAGLTDAGSRLAAALRERGDTVVVIDETATANAAAIAGMRKRGVIVVAGDPTDPAALGAARVERAAQLVAVSDDDAVNVSTIAAARARSSGRQRSPRCAAPST